MYEAGFDDEYRTEDIYSMKKKERQVRPVFQRDDDIQREVEKEIVIKSKVAMPRLEERPIEPLKRLGPKVIGNLFDRLEFLKERIEENVDATNTRKNLHKQMTSEIDDDIKEKSDLEVHITDWDEKRNLKLDISLLRREKRQESVQFWRDLLELQTELKEISQEYVMEKKIVDIFKDIRGESNAGVQRKPYKQ